MALEETKHTPEPLTKQYINRIAHPEKRFNLGFLGVFMIFFFVLHWPQQMHIFCFVLDFVIPSERGISIREGYTRWQGYSYYDQAVSEMVFCRLIFVLSVECKHRLAVQVCSD